MTEREEQEARTLRAARIYTALASAPLRGRHLPTTAVQLAAALDVNPATLNVVCIHRTREPKQAQLVERIADARVAQALRVPEAAFEPNGPCPACGVSSSAIGGTSPEVFAGLRASTAPPAAPAEAIALLAALEEDVGRLGGLPIGARMAERLAALRRLVG